MSARKRLEALEQRVAELEALVMALTREAARETARAPVVFG